MAFLYDLVGKHKEHAGKFEALLSKKTHWRHSTSLGYVSGDIAALDEASKKGSERIGKVSGIKNGVDGAYEEKYASQYENKLQLWRLQESTS